MLGLYALQVPNGPGGEIDLQDDLPRLCRASHADVRRRRRCAICDNKISFGTLMTVNRSWTVFKHAACVSRARQKINSPSTPGKPAASGLNGMRVAVTGGRDYASYTFLAARLDTVPVASLCHGGASGADFLAGRWAKRKGIPVRVYQADWGHLGPRAGPVRNEFMLDHFAPGLLVAFRGGDGTAHCIGAARERKIPVWDTSTTKTLVAALIPMATTPSPTTVPCD